MLVNIGSGNGLVPDGTKSIPEPIFIFIKFVDRCISQEIFMDLTHNKFSENSTTSGNKITDASFMGEWVKFDDVIQNWRRRYLAKSRGTLRVISMPNNKTSLSYRHSLSEVLKLFGYNHAMIMCWYRIGIGSVLAVPDHRKNINVRKCVCVVYLCLHIFMQIQEGYILLVKYIVCKTLTKIQ